MARKHAVAADKQVQEAIEQFQMMCEVRYDIAKAAFDYQDDETQEVLRRIVDRLRLAASGYITVALNPPHGGTMPVRVEQKFIDYNLLYVATEILKDLAMFGIRVSNYEFPPSHCITCGAEIVKERKPKGRRKARVT